MAGQVGAAASRVLLTVLSVKLCSAAMRAEISNIVCIVVTLVFEHYPCRQFKDDLIQAISERVELIAGALWSVAIIVYFADSL